MIKSKLCEVLAYFKNFNDSINYLLKELMKPNVATFAICLTIFCLPITLSQQRQALFIKRDIVDNGKRVARQTSADQMVQNILQWLQGVYTDNSRRIRQGSLREYLPPVNTQRPRPFQTASTGDNEIPGGYPPAGSVTPNPPFVDGFPSYNPDLKPPIPDFTGYTQTSRPQPTFTPSTNGYTATVPTRPSISTVGTNGYPHGPSTAYPSSNTNFPSPTTGYNYPSPSSPAYPTTGYPSTNYPTSGYPSPTTGYPTANYPNPTTGYPTSNYPQPTTGYPSPSTGYPSPSTGYPSPTTGYPSPSTGYPSPSSTPDYPTAGTGYPSTNYPYPSTDRYPTTEFPTQSELITSPPFSSADVTTFSYSNVTPDYPTSSPRPFITSRPVTNYPTQSPTDSDSSTSGYYYTTPQPSGSPSPKPDENTIPSTGTREDNTDHYPTDSEQTTAISAPDDDDDLRHPPHIHAIDVECSKDMMTINIEFNRQFDGIIYSKGHFSDPNCRYVNENSGQVKYTFTVSLNSCGTEFINAFDTQGQSYLENVLVLQNEEGIQEVWDTVRSVRCLWEGNLKKVLNVALSVDMLNQEIVTFSGDTAMARLDIQRGRGPFAPSANGLVKIGDIMTLVVSVTGDPGFDIQVKDCRAKDSSGKNVVALTDDYGCILKPKLFGAFQKTRNTRDTGASIIAYAFFNAFKFPDVMDLTLECNVDLCKTDCEMCSDTNQKLEPGRRKRDTYSQNVTSDSSVKIGKMLRVILPEDLNDINSSTAISLTNHDGICMSAQGFVLSSALLISLLTSSCLFSAFIWLKYQRLKLK
ncbi:hypothetical protein RI129_003539 [Pyrocoelia pectoralis]|uniref:ZP domain-containing protein n=1 Tax=Pyrocoelia pectoralis TaxID=417401 RepID=A0AAN7ZNE7_9COLE